MKKTNPVIAIACSDLHLSENAPVARSAEPVWFDAMYRPIAEIDRLKTKYECPVLFCGDLFDKWNPHPVLINFALESLPDDMTTIPGNHDCPYGNSDLIGQSAYWTLATTGIINDLNPRVLQDITEGDQSWVAIGFPFGSEISKPPNNGDFFIAMIHAYMYCNHKTAFKDASANGHIRNFNLAGYNAVFVGDNHIPWQNSGGKTSVMNCGTMMRRRADEIDYKPGCGLLRADGAIDRYEFDCSADKFIDGADKLAAAETATGMDLSGFADELKELAAAGLDFRDALIRRCGNNVSNDVKKIILRAAGL